MVLPHYHFVNEQIQFAFVPKDGKKLSGRPEKIYTISNKDLPYLVLLFLTVLKSNSDDQGVAGKALEACCTDYRSKLQAFLGRCGTTTNYSKANLDQLRGSCILACGVAQAIKNHFSEKVSPDLDYPAIIKKRFEKLKQETEKQIANYKKQTNNQNKYHKTANKSAPANAPKIGKLANWLAKDLLKMMPATQVKRRISADQYIELQKALAYFSDESGRKNLEDKLKELGLIGGAELKKQARHPFVAKIFSDKPDDLRHFYRAYLDEKALFNLENTQKIPIDWIKKYPFLNLPYWHGGGSVAAVNTQPKWLDYTKKDYLAVLLKRLAAEPIILPARLQSTCFFETSDKISLRDRLEQSPVESPLPYPPSVIDLSNKLVFWLFKNESKPSEDGMLRGSYQDIIAAIKAHCERAKTQCDAMVLANYQARLKKFNQMMRRFFRVQAEDKVLFAMIANCLGLTAEQLRDMNTSKGLSNLLDCEITLSYTFNIPKKNQVTVRKQSKIRHFGSLRALQRNKRATEILRYVAVNLNNKDLASIESEKLQDAVKKMDNWALSFFKQLLLFEKTAECNNLSGSDYIDFNKILTCKSITNEAACVAKSMRNAFSHNGFFTRRGCKDSGATMDALVCDLLTGKDPSGSYQQLQKTSQLWDENGKKQANQAKPKAGNPLQDRL